MDVWFAHWKNHALWNASGTSTVWDEVREQDHPISDDEYAEGAVYLLKYLKTTKQFTNIKYFSMWNEPNGCWAYSGSYPTQWWPLTQAFHNQMVAQGVSNNVYMIAPDTSNGYTTIVPQLSAYGSYIDVISDHDYTSKSALFNGTLRNYKSTIDSINSYYGKDTPFLIGEFGNSGNGSGTVTGDDNVYNGSLSLAQMVIHNLNNGVKGMLRWQFSPNATLSENNNYTAVTINDPDYYFKPYSPVYYPHAVQARYIRKGMNVYEQTGESGGLGANGKSRVRSAYLKDSANNTTILIANDSTAAKNVTLRFGSGLYTPASFHQVYVNGASSGLIEGSDISVSGGQAAFTLNGNTIMALTTLDPGTMTDPLSLYSLPTPTTSIVDDTFDSAGNMAETIAFDGGVIKANIGGSNQTIQTFTPGVWYDIDLVIDTNTDKFDFYVNHMKKRTQVSLRSGPSDITKIRFGMGSSVSGTLYIDDVKVYN